MSDLSSKAELTSAFRTRAVVFIVLIGCVSLFADMTYEGARSVAGPFLGSLGASALTVSIVAGLGEFLGYALRYVSGRTADRTKAYWPMMIAGYVVNLLSVPLLALAGNVPAAFVLFVCERLGRAIRAPIRGAMLSHAATRTGAGWGFGLHTALDQTGGATGPLLVALFLGAGASFHLTFAWLLAPALASLSLVAAARFLYPDPKQLELRVAPVEFSTWSLAGRQFRLFTLAGALIAAGYADFALIGYHFARAHILPIPWIPALYAVAMAAEGVFALLLGRWLDRFGAKTALAGIAGAALASPLAFLGGAWLAIAGIALWGLGMATQDTILHAMLSRVVDQNRRATAFGLFDACRGAAWLAGSVALGLLYGVSVPALVALSLALQLSAVPVLWWALRRAA